MSLKFLELFQGAIEFKGELIESSESENFKEMGKEYSISLWLLLQKPLKGRQVTVFHKGDNFSCQPTISLQEKNLLVKFDTGRGGSERLFASAEIPIKN